MMQQSLVLVLYVCCAVACTKNAVVAFTSTTPTTKKMHHHPTNTHLRVAWLNENMELARNSFPLWTFGAAGSGGIARNVIPKTIDEYLAVQKLKEEGATKGGPTIGLSPLLGYPRDLTASDVDQIVLNQLTVAQLTKKFPVEGNFLAAKGYLTLEAFQKANAKANPLTVKAIFDSFGKPECVEPFVAQECLDNYKNDVQNNGNYQRLKQNLFLFKLNGFSAIVALLFLLGLADVATATDAYHGWFPDWPGGVDFPKYLFTKEGNPFTIPEYYTWDMPEDYVFDPK